MAGGRFAPTHQAPPDGLATWAEPDPSAAPQNRIGPDVAVEVVETTTGWARVRCSNGWETWVDAAALVAVAPPAFVPTHQAPPGGLATWAEADPSAAPQNRIGPAVPVEVVEAMSGWARVRCSNGWETWVDARELAPLVTAAPSGVVSSPVRAWAFLGGAALAIVGGFLPWYSAGGESVNGWDIPLISLFDHENTNADAFPKAGLVLLVLVLAALPLATRQPLPWWGEIGLAAVATNVAGLGLVLYLDLPDGFSLGIGLVLSLVGAVAMAGAALARGAPALGLART